jgi:hypothetical protein
MSFSFSAGASLIILGVLLLLLIVPGVTEFLGALLGKQIPAVWRKSTKLAFTISGIAFIAIGLAVTFKIEIPESPVTPAPTFISTASPVGVTSSIASSTPATLTPVPTPTAWPLGDQTATDPKPLCRITVGDFREPGRDHAKALQFTITGPGGYCSWIVPLHGYNASTKEQLTFWVKGQQGGEQFEVGIKDGKTIPGLEPKVSETASASWTQVSIFLDRFKNQDVSSLENVSLNFTTGSSTIYVDQLIFIP